MSIKLTLKYAYFFKYNKKYFNNLTTQNTTPMTMVLAIQKQAKNNIENNSTCGYSNHGIRINLEIPTDKPLTSQIQKNTSNKPNNEHCNQSTNDFSSIKSKCEFLCRFSCTQMNSQQTDQKIRLQKYIRFVEYLQGLSQ